MGKGVGRTVKHGKITLKDGTGTPVELELGFDGEFTWSGGGREKVRIRDRDALGQVIDGDAKPVAISFSAQCNYILADTGAGEDLSPYEFLTQTGNGSTLASTAADGESYGVDIELECSNPDASGKKETIAFAKFRLHEPSFSESTDGNKIEFSGEAESLSPARA